MSDVILIIVWVVIFTHETISTVYTLEVTIRLDNIRSVCCLETFRTISRKNYICIKKLNRNFVVLIAFSHDETSCKTTRINN